MSFRSLALRSTWILALLAWLGCAARNRDRILADHSLEDFLGDRPQSAALLRNHPLLQEWLSAQWRIPIQDYRIFWSDDPPAINLAEHGFMPDSKLIVIRLSNQLTPIDQLTALCFEICNAQGFSDIDELAEEAKRGGLSREEYIRRKSEIEFHAVLRTRGILRERLPLSLDDQQATNLYRHLMVAPAEFEAYRLWNSRIAKSNYARTLEYYGVEYDQLARRGRHP
jgi:hypothetical protein